jgi:hypothetical protein
MAKIQTTLLAFLLRYKKQKKIGEMKKMPRKTVLKLENQCLLEHVTERMH